MAIVGVASIRVRPDLTDFRKELKSELAAIKPELTVKVKAELAEAKAQIDKFVVEESAKDITKKVKVNVDKNSLSQADNDISKVTKSLDKFATSIAGFGGGVNPLGLAIGAGLLALPNVLHTLIPLLTATAGAALLIPGALIGVGSILLTLGLAAKTLKKELKSTFDGLKQSIQQSFNSSLAPAVANLKTILPQLRSGFQSIATAIGGVITKITIMLKTGGNTQVLNSILIGTSRIVQNLGKAFIPLLQAFLNVAKIGTDVFVQLTSHIGASAQRLAAFTGSAVGIKDISDRILLAIAAFKTLGDIIHTLGSIIGGVFSGLAQGGGSVGGSLVQTLHTINDAIHSISGQAALAALGTALSAVGHAVALVLGPAIQAVLPPLTFLLNFIADHANVVGPLLVGFLGLKLVAPLAAGGIKLISGALEILSANPILLIIAAIVGLIVATGNLQPLLNIFKSLWEKIAPILRDIANAVMPGLRRVFETLKPVIGDVVTLFGHIVDALTPLIVALLRIAQFVLPILIDAFNALMIVLGPILKVLQAIIDAIGFVIKFVGGIVGAVGDALSGNSDLGKIVDKMKSQLDAHSKGFLKPLTDAIDLGIFSIGKGPEAADAGKRIIDGLTFGLSSSAPKVHDFFTGTITGVTTFIGSHTSDFFTVGQALTTALSLGFSFGSTAFQTVAQGFADGIVGIFKHPDYAAAGADISKRLGDGMSTQQQSVLDQSLSIVGKVFFGFHSQDIGFTIAGINIVNLFSGGMTSQQQAVVNQAIAIIDRVLGGWKTQDANFAAAGADIVNRFTDGVRAAAPNLQSVSQTVANGVHAAFAGVSLFGVGNSIMDSLANGLNAKRNFLQQVLSGITAMIPAGKGPPQKDRVLLKPAGESIMDGLIGAIVGKQAELQLALAGVTNTITSAFDPTASGFNPAISAQLGASLVNTTNLAATPVIVNVNTDTPALKDFISVQINDGNRDTRRRVLAGG